MLASRQERKRKEKAKEEESREKRAEGWKTHWQKITEMWGLPALMSLARLSLCSFACCFSWRIVPPFRSTGRRGRYLRGVFPNLRRAVAGSCQSGTGAGPGQFQPQSRAVAAFDPCRQFPGHHRFANARWATRRSGNSTASIGNFLFR